MYDTCPSFSLEQAQQPSDSVPACQQIWKKALSDGGVAVAIVNFDTNAATVTCDDACMAAIGFSSVSVAVVPVPSALCYGQARCALLTVHVRVLLLRSFTLHR